MDKQTTIEDLKNQVKAFTKERDWDANLCPKTISIYLSLEASELLEHFTFIDNAESTDHLARKRKEIEHELADVTILDSTNVLDV